MSRRVSGRGRKKKRVPSRCRARCVPKPPPSNSHMAVYTDVAAEELAEFLKGLRHRRSLLSYKGHRRGRGKNSNFPAAHQQRAPTFSRSMKKRVAEDDLPYFLSLMAHLAERGVKLPAAGRERPRKARFFQPACWAGRPRSSISSRGVWPRRPNRMSRIARGVGAALARMHLGGP